MKKLIAILAIMIVLVGAVFSANNDELVVKATVEKIAPVFKIYGSTSNPVASTIYGTNPLDETTSTVTSSADPSSENVVVYVRLAQYGKAKYKNTALSVTVTPTPLYLDGVKTETDSTKVSALPTVVSSNTNAQQTIKGTTSTTSDAISNLVPSIAASVATYTLNYTGIAVGTENADTNIDTLTMTWAAKDALIPGDYKAYITLGYTTD